LGHLTRKNPSPYDLYYVGGTVSLTQSVNQSDIKSLWLSFEKAIASMRLKSFWPV